MRCFNTNHKTGSHSVIVIGEGLIGSAIARSLALKLGQGNVLPIMDYHLDKVPVQIGKIERWLTTLPSNSRIDWIWSAGKAGFNANAEACDQELGYFTTFCEGISSISLGNTNQFHLLSSAGGLFEGMRLVAPDTLPCPLRPYGYLKHSMEIVVQEFFDNIHIYRPSSVFGAINDTHRLGMVATLLKNARNNALTQIWGNPSTLRDYVWAEDIGGYICRKALAAVNSGTQTHFLVTAKPTSISEVLSITQRITHKPLHVQFNASSNATDITFCPSALPEHDWLPHDLETGARHINHHLAIAETESATHRQQSVSPLREALQGKPL